LRIRWDWDRLCVKDSATTLVFCQEHSNERKTNLSKKLCYRFQDNVNLIEFFSSKQINTLTSDQEGKSFNSTVSAIRVIQMSTINQHQKTNTIRRYLDAQFLICNSCFWCASYLSGHSACVENCPTCKNNNIEFIPISQTEGYKLNIDSRGLSMEFWNLQK